MIYHSSTTDEVLSYFEVDSEKGLPTGVADQRLIKYGKNIMSKAKKTSLLSVINAQLKSHINIIILISGLLSLTVNLLYNRHHWYSPILIFFMLALNIVITTFSEMRTEKITDSIKTMNIPHVKVLRDGKIKTVDASYVVPGDILVLETGDYIVADARLISTSDFRCDESFVTGEEITAEKNSNIIHEDITALNERSNMVYAGSNVITGHARAVVTETAMNTEVGKAVTILETYNCENTKLKDKLTTTGKICSVIITVFCALAFLIGIISNFKGSDPFAVVLMDSLINSVVLLVSILPDGLPVMLTSCMGFATHSLVKKGMIIKDFSVFDSLTQVSVICSDKTGTLTQDKMQTEKIFNGKEIIDVAAAYEDTASVMILRLASLCTSQSENDVDSPMYNDATELAIIDAYEKNVGDNEIDIHNHYPRLYKLPFDPERKITVTVNMIEGVPIAIAKGAPESLLGACKNINSELVSNTVDSFAAQGMRVIAVAFCQLSEIPSNLEYSDFEDGLNFAGFIALSDPPQSDSISLVEECDNAGIRTVMITGDYTATAKAVARRLGILKNGTEVISGEEVYGMSDDELKENINKYSVFARLLPDQKLRIVNAFKENGMSVAITGDSVNDAAALSTADIGIAMGNKGTDVARGAADIIMNNNRFSSIIGAINGARGLFCGIRKALTYLLSSNIGEFLSVFLCLCIFGKFPLGAAIFLLVNLVTDSFPMLSILSDGIYEHKPMNLYTDSDRNMFTPQSKITIIVQSIIIACVSIIAYSINFNADTAIDSTMMFTVLIMSQLFNMLSTKFEDFVYKFKHFKNLYISVILGITVMVLILLVLTPLGSVLGLARLSFKLFMSALLLSFIVFISGELIKLAFLLYKKFSTK